MIEDAREYQIALEARRRCREELTGVVSLAAELEDTEDAFTCYESGNELAWLERLDNRGLAGKVAGGPPPRRTPKGTHAAHRTPGRDQKAIGPGDECS